MSPRTDGDADGIDLPTMFLDPTVVQSMKAGPTVGNLPQVALGTQLCVFPSILSTLATTCVSRSSAPQGGVWMAIVTFIRRVVAPLAH